MEKIRYTLENLDCAGCAAKAEAAVNKAPWIEKATVDFMNKRLTVHLSDINPNADRDIQKIIDSVLVGVNVVLYEGESSAEAIKRSRKKHGASEVCDCCDDDGCEHSQEHGHSHEHGGEDNEKTMFVTTVMALLAGAVGIAAHFISFPAHETVSAVGYIAAILFAGYDVMINGVKSIFKRRIDETTLMTVAVIAAMVLGEFVEGAAVMVLFGIGELLEDKAVEKSRRDIRKLADIRPDTAYLCENGKSRAVPAAEVPIGSLLEIPPHSRVPLDGVITEGSTTLDTSSLTGESKPVDATVGTELLSGMVNNEKTVFMQTTKAYADSAATRIVRLVEESAKNKY